MSPCPRLPGARFAPVSSGSAALIWEDAFGRVGCGPAEVFATSICCNGDDMAMERCNRDRKALFTCSVKNWLATCPTPTVEALAADTDLSLRQVERNCRALYGTSPKALARETRAMRAVAAIASNQEMDDEVIEYGFYDQSHMIREIKHFTGMTPSQIRSAGQPTGAASIARRS